MIGLRPGLQAIRARAAFDGPTVYEAATLEELPPANEVAADTVGFVGSGATTEIYRSTGSVWLPERVLVDSAGELPATAAEGALALVGTSTPLNRRAGWVRQTSAWTELPAPPRSLTSYDDVAATDVDGDWGYFVHAATGEVAVVRLRTIAIAAGAGGGSVRMWVPPVVHDATNPTVRAYIVGDETMPGYGSSLRGYTYVRNAAPSSIGSVSSYMRFSAPAPGSGGSFAQAAGPAIAGPQRWYIRTTMRGSCVGGFGSAGIFPRTSATNQSQWSLGQYTPRETFLTALRWSGSDYVTFLTANPSIAGGGQALNATTPILVEAITPLSAINSAVITRINGSVYFAHRRDHNGATTSTTTGFDLTALGSQLGTSSGTLDIRDHYVITLD